MLENLNDVKFTSTPYPIDTHKNIPNSNVSISFTTPVNEPAPTMSAGAKFIMTKDTWKAIAQNNIHKDEWLKLAYAGLIKIID